LAGTFPPFRRASESPIAIASLRLFTRRPLRPLFSFPRFILCITNLTDLPALFPYRAIDPPSGESIGRRRAPRHPLFSAARLRT